MRVFEAICLEDYEIVEGNDRLELKRGTEYTVSAVRDSDDTVVVFSRYWARVPANLFGGVKPLGEHGEPFRRAQP